MDDESQLPEFCNVQLLKTETLSTGSYGVICKAMCDGHLCAAKFLHPLFFHSDDPGIVATRTRFEQECRFLSEMRHPHIIEYLGTTHNLWRCGGRETECSLTDSCLVIIQDMLTTVGGWSHGWLISGPTNSLLSLTGKGRDRRWSSLYSAMITERQNAAAVYKGCSLIVAGGTMVTN